MLKDRLQEQGHPLVLANFSHLYQALSEDRATNILVKQIGDVYRAAEFALEHKNYIALAGVLELGFSKQLLHAAVRRKNSALITLLLINSLVKPYDVALGVQSDRESFGFFTARYAGEVSLVRAMAHRNDLSALSDVLVKYQLLPFLHDGSRRNLASVSHHFHRLVQPKVIGTLRAQLKLLNAFSNQTIQLALAMCGAFKDEYAVFNTYSLATSLRDLIDSAEKLERSLKVELAEAKSEDQITYPLPNSAPTIVELHEVKIEAPQEHRSAGVELSEVKTEEPLVQRNRMG